MKNFRILFALIIISPFSYSQNLEEKLDEVKYRNIGPFRGGRSVASVGVVGDPLTYYMGTVGGGLWKTTNAGVNWFNISDDYFKTSSVGAIAVADSDSRIIYVGMGEHAPRGVTTSYGDGVYKSIDSGETWEHIGLEETQQISRIIIHPLATQVANFYFSIIFGDNSFFLANYLCHHLFDFFQDLLIFLMAYLKLSLLVFHLRKNYQSILTSLLLNFLSPQ